jgi:D-hydroxyproline dehydrogenase subunit beta
VIGAGIVGSLTAWRLCRAGLPVMHVSDPGRAGTTSASAAVVRVLSDEPLLVAPSLAFYREWTAARPEPEPVFHSSGVAVVTPPALAAAVRAAAAAARLDLASGAHGLPDGYERNGQDAWLEPQSGYADPIRMVASFRAAIAHAGATVRTARVGRLRRGRGVWRIPIDGGEIRCRRVIVACGAATPALLPDAAGLVPIRRHPVRVALFENPGIVSRPVVDLAHGVLIRPHPDGVLATTRAVGTHFLAAVRDAVVSRLPRLAGVRPRPLASSEFDVTDDGAPLIGAVDDGLWVACGLNGKGFKTAPAWTEALTDLILGQPQPRLEPAAPRRSIDRPAPAALAALA